MNKSQNNAITRFVKAYEHLEKVGLKVYLHESGMKVCKLSELPNGSMECMTADDVWSLYPAGKVVELPIYMDNFNT